MTALESRISAIQRPPDKSPPSAWAPVEAALTRLDQDQAALLKDMQVWSRQNMGAGKISPELGNAFNELLRCAEGSLGNWISARHTWAMAGAALDLKGMAARDAAAEKDYKSARDAVGALLK